MKSFFTRRILVIAMVFVLTIPLKSLAQNSPNAPEAASFEPVDATDMVNMLTGGFTYVLPLLNVPSPEGGYPIALSYHAGIAMDQEASWVGLGWNLNPGAINRTINGYPDDYSNSQLSEFFFDTKVGQVTAHSLSLGYSNGVSIGLGFSWGSHQSFGGHVSIGYGAEIGNGKLGGSITLGTEGVSVGIGGSLGGLSLGVSASTSGVYGGSIGLDSNGVGFSVGASSDGSYSFTSSGTGEGNLNASVGISFSSKGASMNFSVTKKSNVKNKETGSYDVEGGGGIGISFAFNNTVNMADYVTETDEKLFMLFVPTPVGVFNVSYGKQELRYVLNSKKDNYVYGAVHFNSGNVSEQKWLVGGIPVLNPDGTIAVECSPRTFDNYNAANDYYLVLKADGCYPRITTTISYDTFMDIYEVPAGNISSQLKSELSNITLPGYDIYQVQAQGLSGGMSSRHFENGNLFGKTNIKTKSGYTLNYSAGGGPDLPAHAKFNGRPQFYFNNEISTYSGFVDVSKAYFSNVTDANRITDYYSRGVDANPKPKRKTSSFVEYLTNSQFLRIGKSRGYIKPYNFNRRNANIPSDGIGAFQITAADGRVYHYSLPVYNHEILTRTFGVIDSSPNEYESYFEKRQFTPYATHWLLTAITGPDYIDKNDNGLVDEQDYGYWVSFEYGKWSDAFIWKSPYGKDYIVDEENDTKTWIKGRKQLYYLNKIRTRTHTALFVKKDRSDARTEGIDYKSLKLVSSTSQSNPYESRFIVPSHKQLALDKIILVKNEDDITDSSSGYDRKKTVTINYPNSSKTNVYASYDLTDNVLDKFDDNINEVINKAIKVIDFDHSYSLASGTPNSSTGRLTLNKVNFKGKNGVKIMPDYSFDYYRPNVSFDIKDKDAFGYHAGDNRIWSLNRITTPQGATININYEMHNFKTALLTGGHSFKKKNYFDSPGVYQSDWSFELQDTYNLTVGSLVDIVYSSRKRIGHFNDCNEVREYYSGSGRVVSIDGNKVTLTPNGSVTRTETGTLSGGCKNIFSLEANFDFSNNSQYNNKGGIRVNSIVVSDGIKSYKTEYKYGNNKNGIGYISYLPFAPELQKELPYSSELPTPRVMYDEVSMKTYGDNNEFEVENVYKYNVIKNTNLEDFYKIDVQQSNVYNSVKSKNVTISNFKIYDNLSTIGQLKSVASYNNSGELLSKIENVYYNKDESPSAYGVTKEAYQSYKEVDYENSTDKWFVSSIERYKYPNIIRSSTETKGGLEFTSNFGGKLDPITGKNNEVFSMSSNGLYVKTKYTPAYHIPEYNTGDYSMGSKVDNITNKNMLSQNAVSRTYVKIGNQWKINNATINTWNNNWEYKTYNGLSIIPTNAKEKIWRTHKSYIWKGGIDDDGMYNNFVGDFDNFNWSLGLENQTNVRWQNIKTTTLYNHYSKPLEISDINNNKAASIMTINDEKIIANANAGYDDILYTNAESLNQDSYLDKQISIHQRASKTSYTSHTGKSCVVIAPEGVLRATLKQNKYKTGTYKLSFWVKKSTYTSALINGVSYNGEKVYAGDWVMLNHYIQLTDNAADFIVNITTNSEEIFVDDLRLHPVDATMTSYVYNSYNELSYIIGANNLATHYKYNENGELIETEVEVIDTPSTTGGFKVSKKYLKKYKRPIN